MRNRLYLVALALLLAFGLCSCRLAREDGGTETVSDRLVGVFITTEYLDLFDMEAYFQDHASSLAGGGVIDPGNDGRYQGRVYAELQSRILTNEETGEESQYWEYVFEDLEGISLFTALVTTPEGSSFWGGATGERISDGRRKHGDRSELEGTIYMTPRSMTVLYVNPVYQSADGSVYLTSGGGYSCSGAESEGSVFSQTLEETYTITENGEEIDSGTKVTVHMAVKNLPKLVRVHHMSAQNEVLSREEYVPENLPENIETSAEYLIVETVSMSSSGEAIVREIFEPGSDAISTFTAREDGICLGKYCHIQWK